MTLLTANRPRSANILLVEDNPGDVTLVKQAFKGSERSIWIESVRDGDEAIDYLRSVGDFQRNDRPDLVLLDLGLPKKDGFQVLREIRSDPQFRQLPVVVLSNSRSENDVRMAYQSRANYYLVKPLGLDDFTTAMRQIEDLWLRYLDGEEEE